MSLKNNKVLNIIMKVITGLLIAFTVFMMVFTIFSVTTFDRNDRNLFGIRFYIVRTDSMSPSENNADMDVHFNAGDIIIVKAVKDPAALQPGDIISFMSENPESYGETITHMIRARKTYPNGSFEGYVTFGTNTGTNDEKVVKPEFVLGQYTGKIPKAGHFFAFVKSVPGYICCILIPFLLLIGVNLVDVIRLFRKYKKEQSAALDAEKAEIAEERARNEEILRELLALKEQLAGGAPPEKAAPAETEEEESDPVSEASEEPDDDEEARLAEEEAARKKAEAARKRKETLARKKAEAEAEAARIAAEEEAKRLAEEEAAHKKAEAARKRKETLARKKAEAEAARIAAEAEETEDSSDN